MQAAHDLFCADSRSAPDCLPRGAVALSRSERFPFR